MGREGIDLPGSVEDLRALVLSQQARLDEQAVVIEEKQARVDELSGVVEEHVDRIDVLEELVRLLRHQRFGRTSEKASTHQLGLFNEAEAHAVKRRPVSRP
jgi:hypothetical protein